MAVDPEEYFESRHKSAHDKTSKYLHIGLGADKRTDCIINGKNIRKFNGISPEIIDPHLIAPESYVIGQVKLHKGVSAGFKCENVDSLAGYTKELAELVRGIVYKNKHASDSKVRIEIRGDEKLIEVGEGTVIEGGGIFHERVTVGKQCYFGREYFAHGANCVIGNECFVMGAIVGSQIGDGWVIGPGATVIGVNAETIKNRYVKPGMRVTSKSVNKLPEIGVDINIGQIRSEISSILVEKEKFKPTGNIKSFVYEKIKNKVQAKEGTFIDPRAQIFGEAQKEIDGHNILIGKKCNVMLDTKLRGNIVVGDECNFQAAVITAKDGVIGNRVTFPHGWKVKVGYLEVQDDVFGGIKFKGRLGRKGQLIIEKDAFVGVNVKVHAVGKKIVIYENMRIPDNYIIRDQKDVDILLQQDNWEKTPEQEEFRQEVVESNVTIAEINSADKSLM